MGKTTVSVNLALALHQMGRSVGLLDADVYGPNVPLMMGTRETPLGHRRTHPAHREVRRQTDVHGLPEPRRQAAGVARTHAAQRNPAIPAQREWGDLDYLLIDLPPGTGDVALSLIQSAPLSGAVVVTTPSDVSLEDARKAVNMFAQVRVPILGMVENMSYLIAPGSGERIDVFGHGGGKRTAEQMGIAFLGEIALDPEVRIGGDSGEPVTTRPKGDAHAAPFLELARRLEECCRHTQTSGPTVTVED